MNNKAWQLVEALLTDQRFAVLATQGGEVPHASLVAFAVTPDLGSLVFPTRVGTRKFANLESNPRVALLVDNRTNSANDYHDATVVTAIGRVSFARGPRPDKAREFLLARHPLLEAFLTEPDCGIATVAVSEYLLVTRFESVTKLDPAAR